MALYAHTFCNTFPDDVQVSLDNIVGGVNGAWKVITAALALERVVMAGFVNL